MIFGVFCFALNFRDFSAFSVFYLLNFQSNLTNLRFIIMNFTSKYPKNNDFLGYL